MSNDDDINSIESSSSDNDSFVWEELMEEDDDMISEQEDEEEELGLSCNDFNWDQRTAMSNFSIRFDLEDKDDVSALEVEIDEQTADSTILSLGGDWFSDETEIDAFGPSTMKQAYTNTTDDAILLEKREQKRSVVMAKMLRLESSMQKLGVELGYSAAE